jgi:hypothetical protein
MSVLDDLVGKKITKIRMGEYDLIFETEDGEVQAFEVEGDCCSHSYFFDFYGVRQLLDGGKVTSTEAVDLSPGDPGYRSETFETNGNEYDCIQVYGYRVSVEHPLFGEVSGIVSFRNSSNGYYGGWMFKSSSPGYESVPEITEDVIG